MSKNSIGMECHQISYEKPPQNFAFLVRFLQRYLNKEVTACFLSAKTILASFLVTFFSGDQQPFILDIIRQCKIRFALSNYIN